MKKNNIIIEIPDFLEHIQLSKSRRAIYYQKGAAIPKRYSSLSYNREGFLIDKFGRKILKNPKAAGTPKLWKINGQALYSGNLHPQSRKKAAEEMHKYFRPFVKSIKPIKLEEGEYLKIECEIYAPLKEDNWDCTNKWPFIKWFEDTLTESNRIPDDSVKYVRSNGTVKYFESDKKVMKFIITKIDKNHKEI